MFYHRTINVGRQYNSYKPAFFGHYLIIIVNNNINVNPFRLLEYRLFNDFKHSNPFE